MRRLSETGEVATAPLVTPAAAAAAAAAGGVGTTLTSSPATGSNNASFDANMVIILAALLCVLICALGINSFIRCALHCSRRLTPPGGLVVAGAGPTAGTGAGLKRKALRRIPVEVYGGARSSGALPAAATECAICLGEFADGEKVRVLPGCHHCFHVRCVDMWLAAHSSCPTCRASLAEVAGAGADDDGGR